MTADCDWYRIGGDGGIDSLCTSADLACQLWCKARAASVPRPMNSGENIMRFGYNAWPGGA
jgi:hypothetical protein